MRVRETSLTGLAVVLLLSPLPAAGDETGSIAVAVVRPENVPVTDARIILVELRRSVNVDDEGKAHFDDVPAGHYHLEALSPRFGSSVLEIEVEAGRELTPKILLAQSPHRERIVVTASPGGRGTRETVMPVQVLDETDLRERLQPTLGETLSQEPGVRSSSFAAGASRPIIRGQSGGRVSVLESGLDVGDASTTSPDHAVATDPIGAESIEILRGPAALLYNTSAIGGLVNVIDSRIPDHAPDKPLSGTLDVRGASVSRERSGAVHMNGGVQRFAWHVDGARRKAEDYRIPGFAVVGDPTSPTGKLPNSGTESDTATLGMSGIFDNGHFGAAARRFRTEYGIQEIEIEPVGIPPGPEEEAGVVIDMEQRRFDLRGDFNFESGFVDNLGFSAGATEYEHVEIEGGVAGTRFFNDTAEARLETAHGQGSKLPGVLGLQYRQREALALGEEAFVPESTSDAGALFALQEIGLSSVRLEVGGRAESNEVQVGRILPELQARIDTNPNCTQPMEVDFRTFSASAGVLWGGERPYAVGASLSRALRSPNSEELYSCGPHLATQSFEVGDTNLTEETGLALEVNLRKRAGRLTGEINLFYQSFDDYIYEEATGRFLTETGEEYNPISTPDPEFVLPEFRFVQEDAEFIGGELSALIELRHDERTDIDLELFGDIVRAELRDTGDYLPRIPPASYGIALRYRGPRWYASGSIRHTDRQDRLAPSEMLDSPLVEGEELIGGPTAAFTMVDATVGIRLIEGHRMHEVSLIGRNLTDEEGRVHSSRTKNVAPLPGADIALTYRLVF